MTVSTLDQVTTYPTQTFKELIPQTNSVKSVQDRSPTLNRELLESIAEAELNRTQNTNTVNLVDMNEQTGQRSTSVTVYNSQQEQIKMYMNTSYNSSTYDLSNLKEQNRSLSLYV